MDSNQIKFEGLLNAYCRQYSNWTRYRGIPRYDTKLAHYLAKSKTEMHIRIDFPETSTEVYIPLVYDSALGQHQFQFPAFERQLVTKTITALTLARFCTLAGVAAGAEQAAAVIPQPRADTPAIAALTSSHLPEEQLAPALRYIEQYSASRRLHRRDAVLHWFHQYLRILSYRQLDAVLTVDENGFPAAIEGKEISGDDPTARSQWIELVLIGHLFPLIGLIGRHGLQDEEALITLTYQYYQRRSRKQQDERAAFLIAARHFNIRDRFAKDSATVSCSIPNPLQEVYWDAALLRPQGLAPVFSKTYAKEQVTVSIRPFDLDRDLEMVHRWFHRDHAKAIWQMNWDLPRLEQFYRSLLADKAGHAYIGEINGIPTFNMEVYWATRDVVGNYFDVLPTDYGTHLFIAPTDKEKKFPSLTMQSILSWLFAQPKVGRLVGEGAIESMAALMNKIHVGFKLQGVIEMPHKKAHLNFCYREWYWEKFPANKPQEPEPELTQTYSEATEIY
ncbi:GNAT family N-acetyltransferase [Sphingobacterium sp. UBA7625]|uniref:GNAT family N-acetyltransferase n=1 Tax=Sphingobacterium sp. UBA7625 TaxID=1947522 RepID=UPI00257A90A1|nr:GNAT family N-acetyltransferase [Sphingobacterium sp. UBA7625]